MCHSSAQNFSFVKSGIYQARNMRSFITLNMLGRDTQIIGDDDSHFSSHSQSLHPSQSIFKFAVKLLKLLNC